MSESDLLVLYARFAAWAYLVVTFAIFVTALFAGPLWVAVASFLAAGSFAYGISIFQTTCERLLASMEVLRWTVVVQMQRLNATAAARGVVVKDEAETA